MRIGHEEVFARSADRLPGTGPLLLFTILWSVIALHLFLLDAWLDQRVGPWLHLPAAVCVYCALFAEPRALPLLLLPAAAARALLAESPLAVEVLALGVPVALLLPARPMAQQGILAQWAAGLLLVVALPRLSAWFVNLSGGALLPTQPGWAQLLVAVAVVPAWVALLRRLPPLDRLQEPHLRRGVL